MRDVHFLRYLTTIYHRALKVSLTSGLTLTINLLRQTVRKLSFSVIIRVQDVISTVNCFLFVEGHLFKYIVLTC